MRFASEVRSVSIGSCRDDDGVQRACDLRGSLPRNAFPSIRPPPKHFATWALSMFTLLLKHSPQLLMCNVIVTFGLIRGHAHREAFFILHWLELVLCTSLYCCFCLGVLHLRFRSARFLFWLRVVARWKQYCSHQ